MTEVATVVAFFGTLVTAVLSWGAEVISWMIANPLLLVPVFVFFIAGGAIGIVQRAMGR